MDDGQSNNSNHQTQGRRRFPSQTYRPAAPSALRLTDQTPQFQADFLEKSRSELSSYDRVIRAWAAIDEGRRHSFLGPSVPLSGTEDENRADRKLVRTQLAARMPKPQQSNDGSFDRATDAIGRVFGVSRKRFAKEWNPADPLGPDPETVANWRRNGLPLDPGYGPIVSPFTNFAFRGVPAALDFGARSFNITLHSGISGIGQAARELGATAGNTRRFERDMRAVPETLAGFGSVWSQGPRIFHRFADWLGGSRKNSTVARKLETEGTPLFPVHPIDRLMTLVPEVPGRETRFVSNFRSVQPAEIDGIRRHGLRPDPTGQGYQLEKLFATNAGDAGFFSRRFYPYSGVPHHIVEAKVPREVMKNVSKFRTDGVDAIGIPEDDLPQVPVNILNYSPVGKRR